jgi:outer membrane biosynthesis protein TonB
MQSSSRRAPDSGGTQVKIPVGIEKVLYLAATDAGFREALFADRAEALGRPGVNLLPDEAAVLKCIPDDRLEMMIAQIDPSAHGKRFMQKVAACAVALAATTAGAGCEQRRNGGSVGNGEVQAQSSDKGDMVTVTTEGSRLSGVGTPAGALSDRPPDESRIGGDISVGEPSVLGSGYQGKILGVVRSRIRSVQDCYERALKHSPDLRGEIKIGLVLGKDGNVTEAKVSSDSLGSPSVAECILSRMRHWRFPKPESGTVTATVPVRFPGKKSAVSVETVEVDRSDEWVVGTMGARAGKVSGTGVGTVPIVKLGVPEVEGYADPAVVTKTIETAIGPVRHCYASETARSGHFEGYVELKFVIGKNGLVSQAKVSEETIGNDVVARCALSALKRLRFPRPDRGEAIVTVSFGFSTGR